MNTKTHKKKVTVNKQLLAMSSVSLGIVSVEGLKNNALVQVVGSSKKLGYRYQSEHNNYLMVMKDMDSKN